jgi:hypothetical protein
MPQNQLTPDWETLIKSGQCPRCIAVGSRGKLAWDWSNDFHWSTRMVTPKCLLCSRSYPDYSRKIDDMPKGQKGPRRIS